MDSRGGWGGQTVSYPTLPPAPPGPGYPDPSAYLPTPYSSSTVSSSYPALPAAPPPLVPSLPHSVSPSAPWVASSPSAATSYPDDFADVDVVAYQGGGEPYGSRGSGSGAYWGDSGPNSGNSGSSQLVKVEVPQLNGSGRGDSSSKSYDSSNTEAAGATVEGGVHSFRVKLLGEPGEGSKEKDVVCKIGLDGVRITEPGNGRLMRIYPLDIITRWEVKEPTVFTFWVRTSIDVDQRAVKLKSNSATTTLILDTLTAACIQVFEMVGKEKGGKEGSSEGGTKKDKEGGASSAGSSSSASGSASQGAGLMGWMLARNTAPAAPPPVVEKHHWVPDEEVPKCSNCYVDFGTFVRRHHCRNCGNVFCDKCSRGRTPLTLEAGAQAVRVCDACLAEVTQRLSYEKEKGSETEGPGAGSQGGSSIPSHDELMKRLNDEMKKTGIHTSSTDRGSTKMDRTSSSSGRSSSALPPALTGITPSSATSRSSSGGRSSNSGGNSNSTSVSAQWLNTCDFCTTVALVSSDNPRCPACSARASPPSSTASSQGGGAAPPPSSYPPPPPPSSYPQVPTYTPSPPPPSSYTPPHEGAHPSMAGPPHLWPSGGVGSGGVPPPPPPGPRKEVVACPTCTSHLEVVLPAVGTETMQCGVCSNPFLIGG